jgi:hypothetical protein
VVGLLELVGENLEISIGISMGFKASTPGIFMAFFHEISWD